MLLPPLLEFHPLLYPGSEAPPTTVSPDIMPEKLIEHLCGEVDDRTPSRWSSGLGHAVMVTALQASEAKAEWGAHAEALEGGGEGGGGHQAVIMP